MEGVQTYKGRTYEEDFNEICRLEAVVEVLEKKNTDYGRIAKGAENEFNAACKSLAEYQLIQEELTHFSWRKIKAKLSGHYRQDYDSNNQAIDRTKIQLQNAKYRMQDTKGKSKDVANTLAQAKKEYADQRSYMRRVYTEFNGYEQKINNEKVRLQGMLKEIDEAAAAADEVLSVAKCVYDNYKSAQTTGILDLVLDDSFFIDILKYNKIHDAEGMVLALNASIARMNKELRDVNEVGQVYCEQMTSTMQWCDILLDNVFLDAYSLSRIHDNLIQIRNLMSRVQNIKAALNANRNSVLKELKE